MLIEPVASPAALRLALVPQHGTELEAWHCDAAPLVTQRDKNRIGFVPPCARSYWTSRSPALRIGVRPFAVQSASDALGVHCRLLNSKSMLVVPEGSCTRDQYMFRKPLPPLPSW